MTFFVYSLLEEVESAGQAKALPQTIMATRREFLNNGLGFVALGLSVPTLLMSATQAIAAETGVASKTSGANGGKILVVIEMAGGNDGLNTVVPLNDPLYAKLRPSIGVKAGEAVKIDQGLALHPGLGALGKLYERGQLAVVTGVGYPNPNRSHFQSMDIWQSGDPTLDARARSGWLARYFDEDGHFQGDPLAGVALGGSLPLALWGKNSPASVVGNARDFGFEARGQAREQQLATLKTLYDQSGIEGGTVAAGASDFIRNIGDGIYGSSDALKTALKNSDDKATVSANYPRDNGLANGLQTVAKLITGGLGTRVYYLSMGGFDTHANQPGQHAYLLKQLAEAVAAFNADLELQGRGGDVVVMTFSEFGRRARENGGAGTDHGAASVMFVTGAGVKGGVHGDYPKLDDLDDGDLKHHTDFRSVYATVLGNWLGVAPGKVLGGEFPGLKFV